MNVEDVPRSVVRIKEDRRTSKIKDNLFPDLYVHLFVDLCKIIFFYDKMHVIL